MKRRMILSSLMLIVMLLSACNGAVETAAPTEAVDESPAILNIGWAGYPDTLNPCYGILTESYTIYELVYDSLYNLNLDGTYSLELAESVRVSTDGAVWTFTIRDGVRWHDGQPLTAYDVAFSMDFYQQHTECPYMNVYTDYFSQVLAIDNRTVAITFSEAIPNVESQLFFLYILPEHIWSAYAKQFPVEFDNTAMVGSGAFKLVEANQGASVRLAANEQYYATPPKIDEVIFHTYGNLDAMVQALKSGDMDMITEMPNSAYTDLQDEPNIKVVMAPSNAPELTDIIFNQVSEENCPAGSPCSGHPALKDRNVRLALAHATDKDEIIDDLLLGLGDPGQTLIPPGLGPWYNPNLTDYAYDPVQANRILEEAGYLDTDLDGVREMPGGGTPLIFRINWPSDSIVLDDLALKLAEMWINVGVQLVPEALDPDVVVDVCCPAFDYDILLWGWGSDPDPGFLLSVYTTMGIPDGTSETGYSNPVFDDLYLQQATQLDPVKRQALVWEMQRIVFEDVVYIVPFYDVTLQAYRTDRFSGWITTAPTLALEDLTSLRSIEPVK